MSKCIIPPTFLSFLSSLSPSLPPWLSLSQLPFLFPRDVLPKFRKHVGDLHPDRGGTFDSAFKYFSVRGPKFERWVRHEATSES